MTEKLEYRNTRRGNHEGSIYQTGNGCWRGQITLGYKSDGRPMRQSLTGTTREEVARQIAVASAAVLGGEKFTNDTNVLFGDYADFWLRNIKRYEINTKTYAWYINLLDNHIRPVIGGYPLGKISTSQLQQMLNQAVQDKGQSIRMAEGIRTPERATHGGCPKN